MEHVLERTTRLASPLPEVFAFFSDASNLERLTPPELGFKILTPRPIEMAIGTEIEYRIRLFGFPLKWKSLITRWDPPQAFVDEQLVGPYRTWIHLHAFRETPEGHTEILDRVRWALPFPPLGELARPIVRLQLRRIFDYRTRKMHERFPAAPGPGTDS